MLVFIYEILLYKFLPLFKKLTKPFRYKEFQKNFEMLKSLVDVHAIKQASGELRKIQLNNLNFAKEIINELKQNDINMFMMDGTLLGAERHKGFIPWDDDLDFGMMRADYNKLLDYAKNNFVIHYVKMNRFFLNKSIKKDLSLLMQKNENKVIFLFFPLCTRIMKGTSMKDFVYLDIFPYDYYADDYKINDFISFCKKVRNRTWLMSNTKKELEYYNKERLNNSKISDKGSIIFYGIDNLDAHLSRTLPVFKNGWFKADDFLPLKEMTFEDTKFYAPQNHIKYLEGVFGKAWNEIPNELNPKHSWERK